MLHTGFLYLRLVGATLGVVPRLLIVVASFVAEHGRQGVGALVVA